MQNQRSNQIAGSAQSAHIKGLLELLTMVAEKQLWVDRPLTLTGCRLSGKANCKQQQHAAPQCNQRCKDE